MARREALLSRRPFGPGSAPEGLMPQRAGFNAPLGFESRYSGTGISNGVYILERFC